MTDKLFLDTVLVMDDSPMFMHELQQQFDGDQVRFLFADTLDAFQHQLNGISNSSNALSAMIMGPTTDKEQVPLSLQFLRTELPECRWINVIDIYAESVVDQNALEERLRFRPACTLLANDQHGVREILASCLQALHQDDNTDDLQQRLTDIEERYEMLLDTSSAAIAFVLSGLHIYANPAYLELTGFNDLRSLSEKSLLDLISVCHDSDNLKKSLIELEKRNIDKACIDVSMRTEDNGKILEAVLHPARFSGEECTQITLLEKPIEVIPVETAPIASTDIEGLLSRRGFLAESQILLDHDTDGQAIGVLCVSIDDFDSVKENIGFANSDALINERAKLLLDCLSEETDKVSRYSEYVFVVLVQRSQRPAVEQVVEHIVDTFSNNMAEINNNTNTVTCSVGYCFAGRQTKNIDLLISQSVRAAREATTEGGQQSKRFRPTLQSVDDGNDRSYWQERLRHAIDQNELKLISTLISDIDDDQRQILDLDLCLPNADDGELTYGTELKQMIEGSALSAELERHSIRLMLGNLQDAPQSLMLSITPANHDPKALADWIMASLKYANIAGNRLILSVSSHDLQQNMQPTDILRRALKGTGIRWALDQYGATDNAVQLIKHLQPEFSRLCSSKVPQNSEMARTEPFPGLVKAANETNSQLIACSVDNADYLPSLWQSNITLIQGDFLKQKQQLVG